jgi:hypothetical protein
MVALVPQPRQMPPPAFDKDGLHAVFKDVTEHYAYQSFGFIFDERGAQFNNGEDDVVELRPALFRIQAKMDGPDLLTGPMAAEKAKRIFEIAGEHLGVENFLQCAIQVIASVDAPNQDAQTFVAEHLLRDPKHAKVLGDDFFGGGVRFRRLCPDEGGEDSLSIEPNVNDNSLVFLELQRSRAAMVAPLTLSQASEWTDDAFDFLAGPTTQLLSS